MKQLYSVLQSLAFSQGHGLSPMPLEAKGVTENCKWIPEDSTSNHRKPIAWKVVA